jgi:tetratricopeptide (TPR) repeat protein
MLTQLQVSNPEKIEEYKTAQKGINALVKDIATCDKLADYYTLNFAANQDKNDWLLAALTSLSAKCSAKPIFNTMAEKFYIADATAISANFMALGSLKQRKFSEAIKFYNESAELQSNPLEKATIYYTLSIGLTANDMSKSKEYLNKAISFDPKMGKAYLYLAQLYTNSAKDCGKTDFEKKAVYYLAIETAKKAGIVETSLKPTSDKMAKDFSILSLTTEEIKKAKMNGKTITIGCWINESITFPSK